MSSWARMAPARPACWRRPSCCRMPARFVAGRRRRCCSGARRNSRSSPNCATPISASAGWAWVATGCRWEAKLDGENVALGQLVRECAVVCFEPGSHALIAGAAEERRRYLDWGVFHVEHDFLSCLAALSTGAEAAQQPVAFCNRQRPMPCSRRGKRSWRSPPITSTVQRRAYLDRLRPKLLASIAGLLPELGALDLRYRRGWSEELDLARPVERAAGQGSGPGAHHAGRASRRLVGRVRACAAARASVPRSGKTHRAGLHAGPGRVVRRAAAANGRSSAWTTSPRNWIRLIRPPWWRNWRQPMPRSCSPAPNCRRRCKALPARVFHVEQGRAGAPAIIRRLHLPKIA